MRRGWQLAAGLVLYGISLGLLVEAGLGLAPWDVLHQGVAVHTPLTIGQAGVVMSLVVLLAWVPLRQRPGVGTIANALSLGPLMDVTIAVVPTPTDLAARVLLMVAGIGLNAMATAAYIGARLGPGPRDGLMTGLVARTGRSVRLVRTAIEVPVLAVGWLLGGTVGIGTALYAVAIGPLAHELLPRFTVRDPQPSSRPPLVAVPEP